MGCRSRGIVRRLTLRVGVPVVVAVMATFPTAAFANHPYSVLFVKADGGNLPTEIQTALQGHPNVANVDVFNAGTGTPTVAELAAYDVVLPYSNTDYQNATVLGDNLADFADAGGVVITLTFDGIAAANRSLAGRWVTGEYRPWLPGPTVVSGFQALGLHDSSHPLMQGVSALGANYRISDLTVAPGSTQVAAWSSGAPLVSYKGRVVGVNAHLGSNEWSGDFPRLILNAADWLFPHPAVPTPPVPPAPVVDRSPLISRLSLDPSRFSAARRGGSTAAVVGTRVRFTLSEAATTRVTVQRKARGRRVGGKCVAPKARNRRARPCERYVSLKGSFSPVSPAGANSVRFTGRLRGRTLKPGGYRIVLVATDPAGNRSLAKRASFRIVRR